MNNLPDDAGFIAMTWAKSDLDRALWAVDCAIETGYPGAVVVKARVSAAINAVNYLLGE